MYDFANVLDYGLIHPPAWQLAQFQIYLVMSLHPQVSCQKSMKCSIKFSQLPLYVILFHKNRSIFILFVSSITIFKKRYITQAITPNCMEEERSQHSVISRHNSGQLREDLSHQVPHLWRPGHVHVRSEQRRWYRTILLHHSQYWR